MEIQQRDIKDIKPYPSNAKTHPKKQVDQIAASIAEFGFNQPIVVDKGGVIIVGHGGYLAAMSLDYASVPVIEIDLTEEQAKAYRLADNKLNESEWDMDMVIGEMKGLSGEMINLTGFDPEEIEGMAAADEIGQLAVEKDIDLGKYRVITVEAPEAPRLKARMSFYFENIEDFEKVKEYFKSDKSGQLKSDKLLDLLK